MADEKAKELDVPWDFPGRAMPSIFANQFYTLVGPGLTKLSFGEQVFNEPAYFHSTFTLPTDVAKQMAETILRIIAENQPIWDTSLKPKDGDKS